MTSYNCFVRIKRRFFLFCKLSLFARTKFKRSISLRTVSTYTIQFITITTDCFKISERNSHNFKESCLLLLRRVIGFITFMCLSCHNFSLKYRQLISFYSTALLWSWRLSPLPHLCFLVFVVIDVAAVQPFQTTFMADQAT